MERTLTRLFLRTLFLLFCFTTSLATPNLEQDQDHLATDEYNALLRAKRKAQDSSISALQYMENLRNTLTDESGRPKLSNIDDPTEVWAMQDRDVLHNVYRKKPKPKGKCISENRFFFNWESLSESQQHKTLPVERAILRAHLKVIPRLLSQSGPTQVNMDVYMRRQGSSTRVHAGEKTLQVTADSAAWIELNITKGVRSLWPLHANDSQVEISIVLNSSCVKRSPVIFEDPSSISLHQVRRRQRLYALQPLFLVYLSDETVKEIVRNETTLLGDEYENYNDDVSEIEGAGAEEASRQRRSATSACGVEDFEVTFGDLKLDYVLAPNSYNARQCRGSCSHSTISRQHGDLANNHAKIMASAVELAKKDPAMFRVQPEPPCCVPTKYASMTLIIPKLDGSLKYVVYSHMKVTECKCR